MYENIIKELKNASAVGIFVHINPDGDAIGSALAMYHFLKKKGKTVYCFLDNINSSVPEKIAFLPSSEVFCMPKTEILDVVLAVDLGEAHRIGSNVYEYFKKGKRKLCIDHHQTHDVKSFVDVSVVEPSAAATTQIVYKVLEEWDLSSIDADMAQCLFAGLVTDSGGFQFNSTSEETFLIASKLRKYSFDAAELCRLLMRNIPKNAFLLTNRVLSATKFYQNDKIAIAAFLKQDFDETNTNEEDAEAVNNLINIKEVVLAATIVEIGEKAFKVSFRSKGNVSAAACAKCFGGGGHFAAAGCRVYGYVEDVIQKIIDACSDILN